MDLTEDFKGILCGMCKGVPEFSTHECLACECFCCWSCGSAHTQNSRFAHHKLVELKSDELCSVHNQELILFCLDDMKPVCMACAQFSVEHSKHQVFDFPSALEKLGYYEWIQNLEETKCHYLQKKLEVSRALENLKEAQTKTVQKMQKAYDELVSQVKSRLDSETSKVLSLKSSLELKLLFETQKRKDMLTQIASLTLPTDPKETLLSYFPRAQELLQLPCYSPPDFTLQTEDYCSSQALKCNIESAVDAFSYSQMTPSKKWKCKDCGKLNLKGVSCKACKSTNQVLQKLCQNTQLPTKRVRERRI